MYDLLLQGGHVVDPFSGKNAITDVGIKDGQVVAVEAGLNATTAQAVLNVAGNYVIPGIIDLHTHLSPRHSGAVGHKMLARAGVTTTLEIAGPIDSVLPIAQHGGAGLNLALLESVRAGHTVKSDNPSLNDLEALIERTLAKGGLGVKIMGGHYPLTPEATARAIAAAHNRQAYVAFHAGTKATGSNIEGCKEAIALAEGRPLHLAHINSYCRGQNRPSWVEAEEAISALTANPNVISESYLSPMNGSSCRCSDGAPESLVVRRCLETGGYAPTEKGLEEAILHGWANVNIAKGGEVVLCAGPEAAAYWRQNNTEGTVSFPVNPPEPRLRLAVARRADRSFVVDCIATDGGGIPRNVIVEMGLSMVKLQALTMADFVQKTSLNPSRLLGLTNKGHLGIGADADITIVNLERQQPVTTIVAGKVIMHQGVVLGTGSRIITTAAGEKTLRSRGLETIVIDMAKTGYYQGMH